MEQICEKSRLQVTVRDCWTKLLVPKIIELAERESQTNYRLKTLFNTPPTNESTLYNV